MTSVDEIADGIYRLSTFLPQIAAGRGMTFNQFLVLGDEPMLFHCGQRSLFADVVGALRQVIDPRQLRWISGSHQEADETGSLAEWLEVAPQARVAQSRAGCATWLDDLLPRGRERRSLADGDVLDLGGGRRMRYLHTPHVPHAWDAGLFYEERTGTLFCSDLLAQVGQAQPLSDGEILSSAIALETAFRATPVSHATVDTLTRLERLRPELIATMHGASIATGTTETLRGLADWYRLELAALPHAGQES